jgi:hypothetical protein
LDTPHIPESYAEALDELHETSGQVLGAPEVVVSRTTDPSRCGNEDFHVALANNVSKGTATPEFYLAMTIEPPPTASDLSKWRRESVKKFRTALDQLSTVETTGTGLAKGEAAARIVLIFSHYIDARMHIVVPPDIGEPEAFCRAVVKSLGPDFMAYQRARQQCRLLTASFYSDWWRQACS